MTDLYRIRLMLNQLGYFPQSMTCRQDGSYTFHFDCQHPPTRTALEERLAAVGLQCLGFAFSRDCGWCMTLCEAEVITGVA